MRSLPLPLRRVEVLLFVLLFGTYAYFYQATGHNEAARFDQMRALAYDHTLAIDKYWWNTADVIHYPHGGKTQVYPNKAPGGTFLGSLPFFYYSHALGFLQSIDVPEWVTWEIAAYLTIVSTVSAFSALAAVAAYWIARELTGNDFASLLAVLAIWLGTLSFPYSTLFFSHQVVASLLIVGFALCWTARRAALTIGMLFAFIAGVLLGFAVITEYPSVLLATLVSIYYCACVIRLDEFRSAKAKRIAALVLGGALPALLLLTYNVAAFGKVLYVPVEAYAAKGTPFETYKHGLLGFQWRGLPAFWNALLAITVRPKIGMLYVAVERWMVYACSPVLWLALPGLLLMGLRKATRGPAILVSAAIVVYILFVTSYGSSEYDWAGGSYFGSRHLVPLLPFLAIPLAFAAARAPVIFSLLLAVSVFYMLLGTAVDPRISYPAVSPSRDILLPEFLRGHLAQNTAPLFSSAGHYLAGDSVAFNWAKLLRVRGRYQLIPLLVFWAAVGSLMFTLARVDIARRTRWRVFPAWLRQVWPSPATAVATFCSCAMAAPLIYAAVSAPPRHGKHGLIGRYFRNNNWSGKPAEIILDRRIDFDWSQTMPLQPPFTIEWTGSLMIEEPGDYTLSIAADDGALLEIDGRKLIDLLHGPAFERRSATVRLSKGEHAVRIRYINVLFGGSVHFWWRHATRPDQIVPEEVLLPRAPRSTPQSTPRK